MHRFLVVIEKTENNYAAYAPDLLGCIATGKTLEEVKRNMREALELHIQAMIERHLPIPQPQSLADYIAIDVSIPEEVAA